MKFEDNYLNHEKYSFLTKYFFFAFSIRTIYMHQGAYKNATFEFSAENCITCGNYYHKKTLCKVLAVLEKNNTETIFDFLKLTLMYGIQYMQP